MSSSVRYLYVFSSWAKSTSLEESEAAAVRVLVAPQELMEMWASLA